MFNNFLEIDNSALEKENETDSKYKLVLNQIFKQPIDYCKKVHRIENHVQADLELIKSEDKESESVYNMLVDTETEVGKEILPNFASKYSTNTRYLKETQKLLKHSSDIMFDKHIINNMTEFWMNIKLTTNKP